LKTETIQVYKCEYCNKLYQRKHFAEVHEKSCHKNPNNYRKCLDECKHLIKKTTKYYYDTGYGERSRDLELFYCPKKKSFLYPPKVEHDKKWFDLADDLNEPMPKECKAYEPIYTNDWFV
jgi:hypothetical protein